MNRHTRMTVLVVLAAASTHPAASLAFERPKGAIVTPPQSAGAPSVPSNGSSDHPAFSQDDREVRLLAFDSAASNLVLGDTNGRRDIFVLHKARGAGNTGGALERVSISTHGGQANGDSTNPSVDGTTGSAAHCIAFESTATNLARPAQVRGSGVFVRDLAGRRTRLVSDGWSRAMSPSIDGRCRYVAFESHRLVLVRDLKARRAVVVAHGTDPDLQTDGRGVTYARDGQVYYRRLTGRPRLRPRGVERLVSAAKGGVPGNGLSARPVVDDHGHYVAFQSTATDLCVETCEIPYHPPPNWRQLDPGDTPGGRDANGSVSDIYRANLQLPPGTAASMTLMSYDLGYNQLNDPSTNPVISRAGHEVMFETTPIDVLDLSLGSGLGPYTNIFSSYSSNPALGGGRLHLESYQAGGPHAPSIVFNGSSVDPAMSSRGNYVAFATAATGYGGESNGAGISDIMLMFIAPESHGLPTG